MAFLVYVLCALTSLACAVLLLRSWSRNRARLLLWSGMCFLGFFVNNALLVVESRNPAVDLSAYRSLPALLGALLLIYGLVFDSE